MRLKNVSSRMIGEGEKKESMLVPRSKCSNLIGKGKNIERKETRSAVIQVGKKRPEGHRKFRSQKNRNKGGRKLKKKQRIA